MLTDKRWTRQIGKQYYVTLEKLQENMSKAIIYQVLTRLWGEGKFSSFDKASFTHLHSLGVTHIWYTGVIRHSTGKPFVKGRPGSPYSISDYYDVNPYLADEQDNRLSEFKKLIKRTHSSGFKLVIDFIPNHVAPDYGDQHGGIPTFDYCDYDWTDTKKINYSHPDTWGKMYDIVRYWAAMGVDGFRCDMAELVPPEFFAWMIRKIKEEFPEVIFIAEVYEKHNYWRYIREVGFDYLYDKSGLYDTLMAVYRHGGTAEAITWNWQFLGDLQPNMLNFLENHDEVRVASPEFAQAPEKAYAALACSALLNDAPFMIYFGQEVGENASDCSNNRTSIFNWKSAKSVNRLINEIHGEKGLTRRQQAILTRYQDTLALASEPAFQCGQVHDLGYCSPMDRYRQFAWLRYNDDSMYLIVANFAEEDAVVTVHIPMSGEDVRVKVAACDYIVRKLK